MSVVTATLLPEPPPARLHPEDDLQRAVVAYLRTCLPRDATVFAIPNGGKRHAREAARMKGLGVVPGVPDLCVVWRGRALFIELKAKRGVLSPEQRGMHVVLVYCGAEVLVARDIGAVEAWLCEAGVPMRGRIAA